MMSLQDLLIQQLGDNQEHKNCLKILQDKGFPTIKEEEWKYTNLKDSLNQSYEFATQMGTLSIEDFNTLKIPNIDAYRLVFIDGYFNEKYTHLPHLLGLEFKTIAHLEKEEKMQLQNLFPAYNASKELFPQLNNALATDGMWIHLKPHAIIDKPIVIVTITTANYALQMRHIITLEEGAKITLIEDQQSIQKNTTSFINQVNLIQVAQNAELQYYKIQNNPLTTLIDTTYINQESQSKATVYTFSFDGKLIRNNLNFYHQGSFLESNMYGISLLKATSIVDNHSFIDHKMPNCVSKEHYKSAYDEQSKGVFNGKIIVNQQAQKTNAYQQNDNILLSEKASIDTQPQLEIFADDVKCSHGCTIGQLDETGLFYLRQRGIPEKTARGLLLYAYFYTIVGKIEVEELKDYINQIIANRLAMTIDF